MTTHRLRTAILAGASAALLLLPRSTSASPADHGGVAHEGAAPVAPPTPARNASGGAFDLELAASLSFTDDSSSAFPIVGRHLASGEIATDRPTAIFFGAAHCWNTNREAERFVAAYRRHHRDVRFLVVDVASPAPTQKALVERFFDGYIPTLAVLDRTGRPIYARAGETAAARRDASALEAILGRALASD
jgi:hypothetical protein